MKHKFALFYVLTVPLCFTAFAFILFHGFGFRVNRSNSLPGNVYRIVRLAEDEVIQRGDCVTIDLSKVSNPVIEQGMKRGYVSRVLNQPMLKRIAAVPGDTVILKSGYLLVNGEPTSITIASRDSYGGKLSAWPTPLTLQPGQYWLTSDPERGFDSRYFGPVHRDAFTHRAKPVF